MMKTLIASTSLVAMLCGAALAESAPPARPLAQQLDLTMVVNSGNQPRRFIVKMLDDKCSDMSYKAGKIEDRINLCARGDSQIELSVDWSTRDGVREYHNKSTLIVKRNATFDIEGDGAKLTVTVK